MKKAFFILGVESSGTRLVSRLFVNVGCYGSDQHSQSLDHFVGGTLSLQQLTDSNLIVFRRSVPHGPNRELPNVKKIINKFRKENYNVVGVFLTRNWIPNYHSRHKRGHTGSLKQSKEQMRKYNYFIFKNAPLFNGAWFTFNTSNLFLDKKRGLQELAEWTGFEKFNKLKADYIFDADRPHYK